MRKKITFRCSWTDFRGLRRSGEVDSVLRFSFLGDFIIGFLKVISSSDDSKKEWILVAFSLTRLFFSDKDLVVFKSFSGVVVWNPLKLRHTFFDEFFELLMPLSKVVGLLSRFWT